MSCNINSLYHYLHLPGTSFTLRYVYNYFSLRTPWNQRGPTIYLVYPIIIQFVGRVPGLEFVSWLVIKVVVKLVGIRDLRKVDTLETSKCLREKIQRKK